MSHVQGGSQASFEGPGLQELLLTFLGLRLDPVGQLLAVELHVSLPNAPVVVSLVVVKACKTYTTGGRVQGCA